MRKSNNTAEGEIETIAIRNISRELEIREKVRINLKSRHLSSRDEIKIWADVSTLQIARDTKQPIEEITQRVKKTLAEIVKEICNHGN